MMNRAESIGDRASLVSPVIAARRRGDRLQRASASLATAPHHAILDKPPPISSNRVTKES